MAVKDSDKGLKATTAWAVWVVAAQWAAIAKYPTRGCACCHNEYAGLHTKSLSGVQKQEYEEIVYHPLH